jgi:hypothetical protein
MKTPPFNAHRRPARRALGVRSGLRLAVGIALAGIAMASRADITNGSFETGTLAGWTATGVRAVIGTGGGGPADGLFQAYLDTSPSDTNLAPQVSTLSQTFFGGGVVSFSWNFLTNEDLGGSFVDNAFVTVDGDTTILADTFASFVPSTLGGYADMTGYHDLQINLGSLGMHTITFGVRDAVDGGVDSALLIDKVTVSLVPEPTALSLMALGLGVFGVGRRRRSQHLPAAAATVR